MEPPVLIRIEVESIRLSVIEALTRRHQDLQVAVDQAIERFLRKDFRQSIEDITKRVIEEEVRRAVSGFWGFEIEQSAKKSIREHLARLEKAEANKS